MVKYAVFAGRIEKAMTKEISQFVATVPRALHLIDNETPLDDAYYVRHRIETVKRIRLTARLDALALAKMLEEDYEAARKWARYTAQELNHDLLYLRDLDRHGYSEEQVLAVPLFPATRRLVTYLKRQINEAGSIGAVAYSVFVEWNSARVSGHVVRRARAHYSDGHVTGSLAHVGIDDDLGHYHLMLEIVHRLLVRAGSDERILVRLIHDIAGFLANYFRELDDETRHLASPRAPSTHASA